jgi:hypothetical protein
VQDELHAGGLPVGRWTAITGQPAAEAVVNEVASAVEAAGRQQAVACSAAREHMAKVVSWLSVALVTLVLIGGAYRLAADLFVGRYEGLNLLLNIVGLLGLSMVALHLVVGVRGPGDAAASLEGVGTRATLESLTRVVAGWVSAYRADLEADLADLRSPLAMLEQTLGREDAELAEGDDEGTGLIAVADTGPAGEPAPRAVLPPLAEMPALAAPAPVVAQLALPAPMLEPEALPRQPETVEVPRRIEAPVDVEIAPVPLAPAEPAPVSGAKKSLSDYLKEIRH